MRTFQHGPFLYIKAENLLLLHKHVVRRQCPGLLRHFLGAGPQIVPRPQLLLHEK